jgi:hypothetical protein
MKRLTDEELARAIRIDPSQIAGLGPSIDALLAMLLERKRKILEKYETEGVQKLARDGYHSQGKRIQPPKLLRRQFEDAFENEQIRDLERLWYHAGDERSPLARQLVQLVDALGKKYEVDELAAKYEFTGRTAMSIPQALEIKEELEKIDELIKQLEEARETAQIGVIDMEALGRYEPARRAAALRRKLRPRNGRTAGPLARLERRVPAHSQGLSDLSRQAARADLQRAGSGTHRPAHGADRR